jgi:hypothetical protein
MATYTCECGARYRLPEGSEGKRATCKKCGRSFTIPAEDIPIAPADDDEWGIQESPGGAAAPAAAHSEAPEMDPSASSAYASHTPDELVAMGRAEGADRPTRGFWADVGWTFVLFIEPNNLIMLVVIWVMHAILPLLAAAPCIGLIGYGIVTGWLCSYWFKVVVDGAAGEGDLPTLSLTGGLVDDVIIPFFKFLGATVFAWAPAILCALLMSMVMGLTVGSVMTSPGPPLLLAVGVSLFLWPMVLLVIGIGGLGAVFRVDLIFVTIARTFVPYLAICVLVAGTLAVKYFAPELASLATGGGVRKFFLTMGLGAFLEAYSSIVAMRIVGLHYHHFKDRFAWSWE